MKKNLFVFVVLTFSLYVAADENNLEQQAQAYCEVFSPNNWEKMRKEGLTTDEMQRKFTSQLAAAVQDEELYKAISGTEKVGIDVDSMYLSLTENISKVIGSQFSCPDLKTYYDELARYSSR